MSDHDPVPTSTPGSDPVSESDAAVAAVIDATAIPVLEYGRAWMMAPAAATRASELGLDGPMGLWVNGRAGVLGEADADVAAAAIGFMAPAMVRHHWEMRPQDHTPAQMAVEYAEIAADYGRSILADIDQAELRRLTALCDKVAAAALPSSGPLFAGWRALARPDDPAGAATIALNVLRELRGGAHLSAVHAVGLGPHRAIVAADDPVRGGQAGAERFGWPGPHPAPDTARRAEAEAMTTTACIDAYRALTPGERTEFVDLVLRARAAIDG